MRDSTIGYFLLALACFVAGVAGWFLYLPESNLPRWQSTNGPKRHVVWNKKQFLRTPGVTAMSVSALSAMGASNIEQMELINGASFEGDPQKIKAFAENSDWVVQEDKPYHVLETLYRLVPVEVSTPKPCPTCPVDPGTPVCPGDPRCPTDPGPGPVETAKSWQLTRIKALEAKGKISTKNVGVCVTDTGIDMNHPDKGNILGTRSFIANEPVSPDPAAHGTHVAGTIGGRRGAGIAVSEAGLWIAKVLSNQGSGSTAGIMQGVVWCGAQAGVKIISMSLGGGGNDPGLTAAILNETRKGIVFTIANGNDSRGQLNYPASIALQSPLVFGIASSDEQNRKSNFSTYGPGTRYIAGGSNVVSNRPGGGTQSMSGTSMATPTVAGALTYCFARNLPPTCLKTVDLGLGVNVQGAGMPDLWATVQ